MLAEGACSDRVDRRRLRSNPNHPMNKTDSSLRSFSNRWPLAIAELFQRPQPSRQRAAAIAEILHACLPLAPATACRLDERGEIVLALYPDAGPPFADGSDSRRARLSSLTLPPDGILKLSLGTEFGGLAGIIVTINAGAVTRGFLMVALPPATTASLRDALAGLLQWAAHNVALQLQLGEARPHTPAGADWNIVGEKLAELIHELNNSLNSMMLQASVLQLKLDGPLREEAGQIRRDGAQAVAATRALQDIREKLRHLPLASDP
jgi:hypothetical protein